MFKKILLFTLTYVLLFSTFSANCSSTINNKTNAKSNVMNDNNLVTKTDTVVIPLELVERADGYAGAERAHVIRPLKSKDVFATLGLNKNEINSINLGWDVDHRPADAYKIIDYVLPTELTGNWNVLQSGNYKAGYYNKLDPLKANGVDAVLKKSKIAGKYDVYLYGMYNAIKLEGWRYGIYWDIDGFTIETETEKPTTSSNDDIGIVVAEPEPETTEYTTSANVVYNSYQDGVAIIDDDAELIVGSFDN